MKRIFIIVLTIIVVLLVTITINTLRFSSKQVDVALNEGIAVNSNKAAERTVSRRENGCVAVPCQGRVG